MPFKRFYKDFYYNYLTDTLQWEDNGTDQTMNGFTLTITMLESKRLNNALKNRKTKLILSNNDIKGLYKRMRQAFTVPFERNLMNQTIKFAPIVEPFIGYIVSETGLIMRTPFVEHVKHRRHDYYRARKWNVVMTHYDTNGKLAVAIPDPNSKMNRNFQRVAKIVYESFYGKTPKYTRFENIDGNRENVTISNIRIKAPKKPNQYRKTNERFNV